MSTTARIAAVALAALAAGCNSHPAPPAPDATTAATTTRTATVEYYAAGVRQFADDIRRTAADLDACTDPTACSPLVDTARAYVGLFGEELKVLTAPGGQGAPPAQITPLVTETMRAVDAARTAGDDFQRGTGDLAAVKAAHTALVAVIDKWQPYGV